VYSCGWEGDPEAAPFSCPEIAPVVLEPLARPGILALAARDTAIALVRKVRLEVDIPTSASLGALSGMAGDW